MNTTTFTNNSNVSAQPAKAFTLSDFDFNLPPELIAQHPLAQRSASRLLDGTNAQQTLDRQFHDLPTLLHPGDLLVFNDTKVIKARMYGEKDSGGKLEILVERVLPANSGQGSSRNVIAHMRVSKKPLPGSILHMQGGFKAKMLQRWPDEKGNMFLLEFSDDPYLLMQKHGHVPLPPYIERADGSDDIERYQTVFARAPGAVAAPTAALHFDKALLAQLKERRVELTNITLHVGAGTFAPVKTENIAEHTMHFERYDIPQATLDAITQCRKQNGRIIAVGTTSVRALESWAQTGQVHGDTNIFITPGFKFKVADLLLTNFHLPKSTLMMLVSAFAGYEHIRNLYAHAIAKHYRFFSYGDAMLLKRSE